MQALSGPQSSGSRFCWLCTHTTGDLQLLWNGGPQPVCQLHALDRSVPHPGPPWQVGPEQNTGRLFNGWRVPITPRQMQVAHGHHPQTPHPSHWQAEGHYYPVPTSRLKRPRASEFTFRAQFIFRADGDAKPIQCPNPRCQKSFYHKSGLRYHIRSGTCTFIHRQGHLQTRRASTDKGRVDIDMDESCSAAVLR